MLSVKLPSSSWWYPEQSTCPAVRLLCLARPGNFGWNNDSHPWRSLAMGAWHVSHYFKLIRKIIWNREEETGGWPFHNIGFVKWITHTEAADGSQWQFFDAFKDGCNYFSPLRCSVSQFLIFFFILACNVEIKNNLPIQLCQKKIQIILGTSSKGEWISAAIANRKGCFDIFVCWRDILSLLQKLKEYIQSPFFPLLP